MADSKSLSFTNIMGQGRVNQLGGVFINGRPLPHHIRLKIIEMASKGIKPCHISRQLRVSHGAVSKILNRYAETGSIMPGQIGGNPRSRLSVQAVEKQILALKAEQPNLCANELRSYLIEREICSSDNAPTVSSINRIFRHMKAKKLISETTKRIRKAKLNHSIENILGISLAPSFTDDSKYESPETSSSEDESIRDKEDKSTTERCRRNRTSFTAKQLEILEAAFNANTYPDQEGREKISHSTGLSEEKIMTWFSNRRARCRKNLALGSGNPFGVQSIMAPIITPIPQQQYVGLFPNQMAFFSCPPTSPNLKLQEPSMLLYPQFQAT
uniref:Homeobox domain-containing protein n=1 Tax=Syphacia muris TaxID=451379 RepID=A0A0N5A992_9BILA